ncbi:hypothetical protein AVEN_18591-1 [Araneus ventricosus]|uniref:Uncharacterized protein n=1 Tax=Araneus ventricosus TaxID=182803 RepID=A0A4Y2FS61_ARAVE|nr:hypothetical protein AVEN_18591-1 [Araneus ventricosus]
MSIALAIWTYVEDPERLYIEIYTFGYSVNDPVLKKTLMIILSSFYIGFFAMPANAFMTFYISVCHDVEEIFHSYKKTMTTQSMPDYGRLTNTYLSLRKFVVEIDNRLNCMVFWAILANVFILYFGVTIITGEGAISVPQRISTFFALVYNAFIFFYACIWANRVSSSAASISEEACHLEENPKKSPVMHNRYLLVVNQGVYMTVWGVLPLKKSFVLASIGTMITYSVLIKDILSEN